MIPHPHPSNPSLQRIIIARYNMQHDIWLKRVLVPFWVVEFAWLGLFLLVDGIFLSSHIIRLREESVFVPPSNLHIH